MRRFSPRLFALGFALGAIGAAAILAINAYASTGTATRRGDLTPTPTASTRTPDQVIQWKPDPALDPAHAGRTGGVLQNFLTSSAPGHR